MAEPPNQGFLCTEKSQAQGEPKVSPAVVGKSHGGRKGKEQFSCPGFFIDLSTMYATSLENNETFSLVQFSSKSVFFRLKRQLLHFSSGKTQTSQSVTRGERLN